MDETLQNQIEQLASTHGWEWEERRNGVAVLVEQGARHQQITVREKDGQCVLTSTVLSGKQVTQDTDRWYRLAELAWRRNAEGQLVSFGFDRKDRLIGQIRHPLNYLDRDELVLYIQHLALACDRFEYVLSGHDRH